MPPARPRLVIKYGGTTISSAARILSVSEYLAGMSKRYGLVVVCSAVGNTTDDLVRISELMRAGDRAGVSELVRKVAGLHHDMSGELVADHTKLEELRGSLDAAFGELQSLIDGLLLLGEETPRSRDYLLSFGERFSVMLLAAALKRYGVDAVGLSGREAGILTDSRFGGSKPLMDTTRLRVSKTLGGMLERNVVPVVGGYSGADQHDRITTFGRGGSDYTATIVGSCIGAEQIWLMGNVDGMMTADPDIVPDARVLEEISYAEAVEMSMFGSKQLHSRTFEPVLDGDTPLRIRSSSNVSDEGTLVVPSGRAKNTIKCVSMMRGNGLIDIRGFGMVGAPGTAAGIFGTLAERGISVMMISQNPSESSITIVLKKADLYRAADALEAEHHGRTIKRLDLTLDVAIVALIGEGLRGTVGTASRVFAAVSGRGINVAMITQGSSELNLAFVVRDADAEAAVRALHEEFGLAG